MIWTLAILTGWIYGPQRQVIGSTAKAGGQAELVGLAEKYGDGILDLENHGGSD